MKKLLAIAALLLASTAAQAQYTFEYGGHTIRIDPDRGTVQIPGVYDNTGRKSKRAKSEEGTRKQKSQEAKTDSQSAPAPAAPAQSGQAAAPAAPPPVPAAPPPAAASTEPSTATAAVAPNAPAPQTQQTAVPAPPPAPAPTVATATPAPVAKPVTPAAAAQANSPIGVWLTEEKEGKVRIEQCGANLCGYAVDEQSNQNGEQVLLNMKPSKDKWSGRILDPNSGSTYDSTIALKGSDTLRVQGCAFGGMFCGGQTWTRVN
ncbi:DUF2147 domain-containing protein [Bradyrhizobium sp. Arg237L]|uniref:DUF2147 domain-containing protein n=1 Tax=Bradyrhizobium sp. Arg237L TaxID=3003352 RepID=UPI00249DE032|nr:DUF2147 domain-containing protein [Bradyrhizobium sp. Arg237L]MDI4237451.1 DUF2147 domain-containing protein [Bradyrhizobium sp. Arg237L]